MYAAALAPTFVHDDIELLEELTTDLKSETLPADYVSSCTSFDFTYAFCGDLTSQPKLATDKGDFYLYELYNKNGFNDPTSLERSSNSWGVFWTTFGDNQDYSKAGAYRCGMIDPSVASWPMCRVPHPNLASLARLGWDSTTPTHFAF